MKITKKSHSARLHAIVHRLGIDRESYIAMLYANYGVVTSKDLTDAQINALCSSLESSKSKHSASEDDCLRKRLIAAIGGWLRMIGQVDNSYNPAYIKSVACRAAGVNSYNKIPRERLRSLYAAFARKQYDLKTVRKATADNIATLASLN